MLRVGDILYAKKVPIYGDESKLSSPGRIYSESILDIPLVVTQVYRNNVVIRWIDGTNYNFGQTGRFDDWNLLFISEMEYNRTRRRNRNLDNLLINP